MKYVSSNKKIIQHPSLANLEGVVNTAKTITSLLTEVQRGAEQVERLSRPDSDFSLSKLGTLFIAIGIGCWIADFILKKTEGIF